MAGWMDVWRLAMSVAAREPVFVQIALAAGSALAVVMCLEGLYASLRPRRYAARIARNYGAASVLAQDCGRAQLHDAPAPAVVVRPRPLADRLHAAKPKFRRVTLVNGGDDKS